MNKIKIPMGCRDFREESSGERQRFAQDFVKEFVLDVAPRIGLDTCTAWTERIRQQFDNLCPKDCEFAPSESSGEYLVDFAWMEKTDGRRVLLACESEWASDYYGRQTSWRLVDEDFDKLLAIKAPFKVLIFSSTPDSLKQGSDPNVNFSLEHAKIRLKESLEHYGHNLPGETYIFIDFQSGNGMYQAFGWIAKEQGKATVNFEDFGHEKLILAPGL